MASPQQQTAPYGQPENNQHPQDGFGGTPGTSEQPPLSDAQPAPSAAGRKKRHYAGQAYEFGGGPNAALGGQQPGGGAYPPPQGANYPAYGQQPQQTPQIPPYGSGPTSPAVSGTPAFGQQHGAIGGYQPPEAGYPAPGASPQPGVGGLNADMGKLSLSSQGPNQPQGKLPMNQLYPTDLLNTNLNVEELDLPPPPIILPPNVFLPEIDDLY